jgi:hypothetical protein
VVSNIPEKENQNEVVFFLGAGASIEAGIPGTHKFIYGKENEGGIQGFLEWLNENNKSELKILEAILDTFQQRTDHPVIDVELVLGTLNALNNKEKYDLVYFYNKETFKFKSEDAINVLKILESDLKEFIRKKVVVDKDKISYLTPLIEFQKEINIFSVNYDTCIEMLCVKHKLKYTDGFDLYWNPELFEKEKEFDIKLYKLHGSIMWYVTDYGNYVKLPIKLPIEMKREYRFPLYSGEIASPFILYPIGRKWEYTEPVGYLTNKLQKHLKSAKLCIVVGYSFRDDDIRRIFFESAKENENLTIILVDPNAGKIFTEKLIYRDEKEHIPSPISDRVICFNYTFGSVLKNNYLYNTQYVIPRIRSTYSAMRAARRGLVNPEQQFKDCINAAIEVGHVYFIEKVFEKELVISPPDFWGFFNEEDQFRLSYSLAIFYLLNSDKKGKKYFEFLRKTLKDILDAGKQYFTLNIELNKAENEETKIEIRKKIEVFQMQHSGSSFYYWSGRVGKLDTAVYSFNAFIQSQLSLLEPTYASFSTFLKATAGACYNLFEIFRYDISEYTSSEKVNVGSASVEIQRVKDLENAIDNLIRKIEDFIEHYEEIGLK